MAEKFKINSSWIERVIYTRLKRKGRENIFPRITPRNWWECDMFSTTKTGRWHEYEIKVTKSDFKADFKKEAYFNQNGMMNRRMGSARGGTLKKKHEMLGEGCEHGPSGYWICAPKGLLTIDDIPEYAGFLEFPQPDTENPSSYYSRYCRMIRQAPKLIGKPLGEDEINRILRCIPYRYQELVFNKIPAMKRKIKKIT